MSGQTAKPSFVQLLENLRSKSNGLFGISLCSCEGMGPYFDWEAAVQMVTIMFHNLIR